MNQKTKMLALQDYDITVTARHMSISEAVKQYAIDKLSKIERFHLRIVDVAVTMDIQRELNRVSIILKANNFKVKSQAITSDMYASIDMAVDKIQTQLRRYHQRIADHHAKGLKEVEMAVNILPIPSEVQLANEEIEEENSRRIEDVLRPHTISNRETRPLKILSFDEAMMKMDLSGDLFLIFRHEEDRKIKVIYRRNDGNYGVIVPE